MRLFRRRSHPNEPYLRPTYRWQAWERRRARRERQEADLGPDGHREHLFVPLDHSDPELADRLRHRFVERWLRESGFPPSRVDEALATVDIRVGPDEDGDPALRVTTRFAGSTRYLPEWSGDPVEAAAFVDDVAGLEAGWVHDERRMHGPTAWD